MKILGKLIFLLIFVESRGFLSSTEKKIFIGLIKRTNVKHCLLAPKEISVMEAVEMTKTLSKYHVFTAFLQRQHLRRHLEEVDMRVYRWTAIALKEPSLKSLDYFENKTIIPSYFWLLFDDSKGFIREELIKVEIPFNTALLLIEKMSDNNYLLSEYYGIKKLTPGIIQKFGEWTNNRLILTETHWFDRKSNMHGYEFVTVKFNEDLYLTQKEKVNEVIWQELSDILNFTISQKIVQFSLNADNFNAEEDEALLDTQLYIEKNEAYRYLLGPTSQSGLYMHIKSEGEYKGFKRFLRPFLEYTWMLIGFWICFCGLFEFLLESLSRRFKCSPKPQRESYQTAIIPLYSLCNQSGMDISNNLASRISLLVIRISAVVFFYFYSATVISCLLMYIPQLPFTDLRGFVEDGTYKITGERNSDVDTFFKISTEPLERLIHKKFLFDVTKWSRLDKAVDRMCRGEKLVVVAFDNEVEKYMPCSIVKIKPPLKVFANGFKIRFRSPFRGILHIKLLLLRTTGILQRVNNKILNLNKKSNNVINGYEINVEKVSSIFMLLFYGILLSVIILALEIINSKLTSSGRLSDLITNGLRWMGNKLLLPGKKGKGKFVNPFERPTELRKTTEIGNGEA